MPETPTVYVTRQIPAVGLDRLRERYEVVVWDGKLPPATEHIEAQLASLDADGLVCLLSDDIDADVLDASPNLSVVSTFSVGYDHLNLAAAAERDIAVGHTPGVLTETTADLAWALLLTCARRTVEGHAYVDADEWETWGPRLLTGADVHDATLGIVGLGKIGTAVARRGAGFGVDVLYTGPTRKPDREAELAEVGVDATFVGRDELLAESDFVSLHVPLTAETAGFLGEAEFRRMPEDAILINTSRGGVVDTDALDTALARGWIGRAGLDVTDPEPLPGDHPILRHAPERLVVTPHIGSASVGTRDRMAEMTAANVEAGIEGDDLPTSALGDAGTE
ncbi:D-glycerate dehydrogenase [Halobellus salinus]|uniref:D-glycerate dehydrogenase n=1 Tax=Halobellus salinus TaxID=931585 RepID=A0A830EH55_9EURY|nr:D-glycerate dehydrogenase [Halobellus salinus]GGJ09620.1 D-glycerate dehydrogenase [Halobellus salinus]SMP27551.1 glyoxylate reductase [Halobellus salinus]